MPPWMLRSMHVDTSAFQAMQHMSTCTCHPCNCSIPVQQGDAHQHKHAYWLRISKQLCTGDVQPVTLRESFVGRRTSVLTCTFELRNVKHVSMRLSLHCTSLQAASLLD